jgi:hypothetical protein
VRRRPLRLSWLIALAISASAHVGAQTSTRDAARPVGQSSNAGVSLPLGSAQDKRSMDITPYKLPDDAFWSSDDRGSDRLATELLGRYEGLLIDAPSRVFIDQRSTLPVAVYQLGKIRDLSALQFRSSGLVAVMDAASNRLLVASGRSFQKDDDPLPRRKPKPESLPEGNMSSVESLELREVLKLPWKTGTLHLSAILRGQVSNRVKVELCQSPACFVDPEVVKFLEAKRARQQAPSVSPRPGKVLPTYRRQADSLPIPGQPGLELAPARVTEAVGDQPWLLRGSFHLKPTPEEWVKPGWKDPNFYVELTEAAPVAVVTVWLLLVGANDGVPHVIPLRVPCWNRSAAACTGQFSLDLRTVEMAPRKAQTYFVYGFSGDNMAGPLPSALVAAR